MPDIVKKGLVKKSLIELKINGEKVTVVARPADTLLDVLREQLGLTGAKPSCKNGDCGACTVLIDGQPIKSCLTLAVEAIGHEITTVEGLIDSPIQKAFVDKFAFQCGYCTSGFIMNCHALTVTHPDADDALIREWLQSNLCRCTGYEEITEAIKSVLAQNKEPH
jgi:carbon-monoxide dehydrogenase small subunit